MGMRISNKELKAFLAQLDGIIEVYKELHGGEEKRDWRTYEQRLALRIQAAAKNLAPLLKEAAIGVAHGRGNRHRLPPEQRALLVLLQRLFALSNRNMASMLAFFSALSGVSVSYKTVERAYSDEAVGLVLRNLFVLLLRKKGVRTAHASGDGTGYGLRVTENYRTNPAKRNTKHKAYRYAFALMDLDTGMYVAYGTGVRSEHKAFHVAMALLARTGVALDSVRLDKYYSSRRKLGAFEGTVRAYLIPKKNATIKGSLRWKRMLRDLLDEPFSYLEQYFLRNNSESGFSTDKRLCGWTVAQRREDRVETALFCTGVWHNLMRLG